jgi:hypothetical protein
LTKTRRLADGVAVCDSDSAGVAVMVTMAVAVRAVGSYVSTTEPVLSAEFTPDGTPLVEMVTLMVIETVVPGVSEPILNVTVGLLMVTERRVTVAVAGVTKPPPVKLTVGVPV